MRQDGVSKSQSLKVSKQVRPRSLRLCGFETLRLLLALLLLPLPAFANITTSSLTGNVTIGGAPTSGVTITVSSPALQTPRTTLTNARGRYWLHALPPGVYDVTFSLAAHTSLTKRAVLELARVARADATLEPNPDEDSTTSTAMTLSVAETTAITTHFDDRALDRLPTGRIGSASLAPGPSFATMLDGVPGGAVTSDEMIEQVTVIRGAAPVEWETAGGLASAFRTRTGGETFFFTLRDTITSANWITQSGAPPGVPEPRADDDQNHFGEATAGGRIVPERLWFFAGAWRGEQAIPNSIAFEGFLAKLDAQLGAAHHVTVAHRDTTQAFFSEADLDTTSLHYTAVAGTQFTSEIVVGHSDLSVAPFSSEIDFLNARGSYLLGDHTLTAGFSNVDGDTPGSASFFVSDRWSYSRWNVYAGLRHDDADSGDHTSPRVAVTYDLRGNGTQAISASWGEYAPSSHPFAALRVITLGYATAVGNAGTARADVIRSEQGAFWQNELQLDARYRLFDRFEAGATYTLLNRFRSGFQEPLVAEQIANVWLGAELPVGSHELGVTLLQHYIDVSNRNLYPTDLAVRYTIPISRAGILLAADATNVFLQGEPPFAASRAVRVWVRVRV